MSNITTNITTGVIPFDNTENTPTLTDEVLFAKTKINAIIPSKRDEDGWYDIYPCFDSNYVRIEPRSIKLVPTGIASAFNPKYRIGLFERGSNTKSGLIVMAGRIDSGFRGEWFVALYNTNDIPVYISKEAQDFEKGSRFITVPYSKAIAQASVEKVPQVQIQEVDYKEILNIKSERGTGMLGSTNK